MIKKTATFISLIIVFLVMSSCENTNRQTEQKEQPVKTKYKMAKYADFKLTTDISHLSANQRKMMLLLFDAAKLADEIFWL